MVCSIFSSSIWDSISTFSVATMDSTLFWRKEGGREGREEGREGGREGGRDRRTEREGRDGWMREGMEEGRREGGKVSRWRQSM